MYFNRRRSRAVRFWPVKSRLASEIVFATVILAESYNQGTSLPSYEDSNNWHVHAQSVEAALPQNLLTVGKACLMSGSIYPGIGLRLRAGPRSKVPEQTIPPIWGTPR
jgi:hypothetical protein